MGGLYHDIAARFPSQGAPHSLGCRRVRTSIPVVLVFLVALAACGGGQRLAVSTALDHRDLEGALAAYEQVRASDGHDTALLGRIAELLLENEASGSDGDRRDAALHQLALAGTEGRGALERLAASGSVHALAVLAEAGSDSARSALRDRIDSEDPEVRAAAVLGLSIEGDHDRLLSLAAESSRRVRVAAVARLGDLAPESAARLVLEERARIDPDPGVRGAAVRALGAFGTAGIELIRERLSDPIASVRMAAVAALLHADREGGRAVLAGLLETPPSTQGIEAARLLATPVERDQPPTDRDVSASRAYLSAALAASDAALRSQAAIALSTLGGTADLRTALTQALGREADAGTKLAIARALLSVDGGETDALGAIEALSAEEISMTSLQASIVLATRHLSEGIDRVEAAMHGADIPLRRIAARALARDAMRPDRAAPALQDPDALVRIQAAGGILAAAASAS